MKICYGGLNKISVTKEFKDQTMKIYTIGFTQKTAQQFFEILASYNVQCLVDIRLHPDGQLSGFSKKEDLRYFLNRLNNCDYRHTDRLAPTDEILKAYRIDKKWKKYEVAFLDLLDQRGIPETLDRTMFEEKDCCLLCSEPTPVQCHRRLVAERLANVWKDVTIIHL
jgi:uncharacterized protein (DUF488 family)